MRVMRAAYNFRIFLGNLINNNVSYLYFHMAFDVLTHIHFTARLRQLFRHSAVELNSFPIIASEFILRLGANRANLWHLYEFQIVSTHSLARIPWSNLIHDDY